MSLTPSTMLELGTEAPPFSLPDTEGRTVSLESLSPAKGYLIAFICNHCPYVKHLADPLAKLAREYQGKGIAVVAISANDVENYPDDSPEKMKQEKAQRGYTFPYLHDASQDVAKAYQAACTPDFFVFDGKRKLVYRGQFDDTRPTRNGPGDYASEQAPDGRDLRAALDAVLSGDEAAISAIEQKPSIGCNIKWKPGNEPAYA